MDEYEAVECIFEGQSVFFGLRKEKDCLAKGVFSK